ncbi:hypothetical protein HY486_01745 [Candidatus Woesearchaeota archaeon]|nr:hypothetical protein [Candidatus Woesearchaeota archaeon]
MGESVSILDFIVRAFQIPHHDADFVERIKNHARITKNLNRHSAENQKEEVKMAKKAGVEHGSNLVRSKIEHPGPVCPSDVVMNVKKRILGRAPEEHTFVLHDGRKLKTVYELIDELETMSDNSFKEYVNDMKNDFSTWIKDVFDEKGLAAQLERMHDRIEAQRLLLKHVVRELNELVKKK